MAKVTITLEDGVNPETGDEDITMTLRHEDVPEDGDGSETIQITPAVAMGIGFQDAWALGGIPSLLALVGNAKITNGNLQPPSIT